MKWRERLEIKVQEERDQVAEGMEVLYIYIYMYIYMELLRRGRKGKINWRKLGFVSVDSRRERENAQKE